MIVRIPLSWRARVVLHGTRTPRLQLFREAVPIRIPDVSEGAVEVCRRTANWKEAAGRTISTYHHVGKFLRPVWTVGSRDMMRVGDLKDAFGVGELFRHWSISDNRYVDDGEKVSNLRAPHAPDHPVKHWESDDRAERLAFATCWVESRCRLIGDIVHEECPEPVLLATSNLRGSDLDAVTSDTGGQIVFSDEKRVISDFIGWHPRAVVADIFRLDRHEEAVRHAASRWNLDAGAVARVEGLEVLRPDLLDWRDEDLALAAAASQAYDHLAISMMLLPRETVIAILDLRDARSCDVVEERIALVEGALSALEDLDQSALPPALSTPVPMAITRLRAGLMRYETFVATTPDIAPLPTPG